MYLVDLTGGQKPRELTSGKQGATRNPVFNAQGDKVAWVELDEDGYESDRSVADPVLLPIPGNILCRGKVVIYDLKKDVRYTLTPHWDRSADELAVRPYIIIVF